MGGAVSTPAEEPARNGHAEDAVEAATEPLLGHHAAKPFDLKTTFSAPLAILTGVFIALFFVFVRQAQQGHHAHCWQEDTMSQRMHSGPPFLP